MRKDNLDLSLFESRVQYALNKIENFDIFAKSNKPTYFFNNNSSEIRKQLLLLPLLETFTNNISKHDLDNLKTFIKIFNFGISNIDEVNKSENATTKKLLELGVGNVSRLYTLLYQEHVLTGYNNTDFNIFALNENNLRSIFYIYCFPDSQDLFLEREKTFNYVKTKILTKKSSIQKILRTISPKKIISDNEAMDILVEIEPLIKLQSNYIKYDQEIEKINPYLIDKIAKLSDYFENKISKISLDNVNYNQKTTSLMNKFFEKKVVNDDLTRISLNILLYSHIFSILPPDENIPQNFLVQINEAIKVKKDIIKKDTFVDSVIEKTIDDCRKYFFTLYLKNTSNEALIQTKIIEEKFYSSFNSTFEERKCNFEFFLDKNDELSQKYNFDYFNFAEYLPKLREQILSDKFQKQNIGKEIKTNVGRKKI